MILASPITHLLRQAWRRSSSSVIGGTTSCDIDRTRIQSRNVVFIQNKAKEEQSVQELQETQRHFNRAFVHVTNGAAYTVSSLQETNNQNEDTTIHHLLQRLSEMESQNGSVKAEVVDWKDKYEQMAQSCEALVEKIGALAEKNEQLRIKCQQLKVNKKRRNDMLVDKIDDLADKNEKLKCELVSSKASREASPMQNTATTVANSSCFSGDVYAQLDQFEHSLDRELEDFQQLAYS